MKIEIMKYNSETDYEIVIDGYTFTQDTLYGGFVGHSACLPIGGKDID